ncbi:MAG: hypothetical protein ACPKQO_03985 [Nitrososphaeraceae archaeon]
MNKSIILTVMLIGTLVPGMILSMPGISVSGSHFQSINNNGIIQEAYAQYGDNKRYDNYKKSYSQYDYGDNKKKPHDQYGYDNYKKKPHDNYKKDRYADYTYTDYKKKAKKNFAQIERFDDKLFVCDNGIVVDDRTQCPLKCPFDTTLEGAYVMDLEICDIEPGTAAKKCPKGTDLEGVLVMKKSQCTIFEECRADSPLGESLGTLVPVKVADIQLCQLSVPDIDICETGPLAGFAAASQEVCNNTILENVQACNSESDLPGMLTNDIASCQFETCDETHPLGIALGLGEGETISVVDSQLCELDPITSETELPFEVCETGTELAGVVVEAGQGDACGEIL